MFDTGHGAVLSLSGTGATEIMGCPRQLTLPDWVQDAIDTSCLETENFRTYVPSDLVESGTVVAEIVFDPEIAITITDFFILQDLTVTWPISNPANNTPATLTGQVFISGFTFPSMATSELQIATLTLKFTGGTTQEQPLFTAESTV